MKKPLSFVSIGLLSLSMLPAIAAADIQSMDDSIHTSARSSVSIDSSSNFLDTFVRVGSFSDTDGTGIETFDFAEFRSHPCYHAVGQELNDCLDILGIDTMESTGNAVGSDMVVENMLSARCADLQNNELTACTRQNNILRPQLLAEVGRMWNSVDVNQSVVGSDEDEEDDSMDDDEDEDDERNERDDRQSRSEEVWRLCRSAFEGQASCFQASLRFVTDELADIQFLRERLGLDDDEDEDEDEDDRDDEDGDDDEEDDDNDDEDDEDDSSSSVRSRSSRSSSSLSSSMDSSVSSAMNSSMSSLSASSLSVQSSMSSLSQSSMSSQSSQ